jgi:NADH dehydrogenase
LNTHIASLRAEPVESGQFTIVVAGAGLTGIETAAEMPQKVKNLLCNDGATPQWRIILIDRNRRVGAAMGPSACPIIERALSELGIETRTNAALESVTRDGVVLSTGEFIPSRTVVWCGGMEANPQTRVFAVRCDSYGRLPVDCYLRVEGVGNVFAAGDSARMMVDDVHESVMSCQHSRPMGRFAGHNAASDLLDEPMLPLRIEWYVTVLDLGTWGALYTEGWDRVVVTQGAAAKLTKQTINCHRIYPPVSGSRQEILEAASPIVQSPPAKRV